MADDASALDLLGERSSSNWQKKKKKKKKKDRRSGVESSDTRSEAGRSGDISSATSARTTDRDTHNRHSSRGHHKFENDRDRSRDSNHADRHRKAERPQEDRERRERQREQDDRDAALREKESDAEVSDGLSAKNSSNGDKQEEDGRLGLNVDTHAGLDHKKENNSDYDSGDESTPLSPNTRPPTNTAVPKTARITTSQPIYSSSSPHKVNTTPKEDDEDTRQVSTSGWKHIDAAISRIKGQTADTAEGKDPDVVEMDEALGKVSTHSKDERVLYFSEDPIENLLIKVTVTELPPSTEVFQMATTFKAGLLARKRGIENEHAKKIGDLRESLVHSKTKPKSPSRKTQEAMKTEEKEKDRDNDSRETVWQYPDAFDLVGWQLKLYSPREVLKLCRPNHHFKTHQERQYHIDILRKELKRYIEDTTDKQMVRQASISYAKDLPSWKVATYVDEDSYLDSREVTAFPTNSSRKQQNPLAMKTITESTHRRKTDHRYQDMHVMLCTEFESDERALNLSRCAKMGWETVLCHVRSFPDGSFEMKPGFSAPITHTHNMFDPRDWYTFTCPKSKRVLCYRLENARKPRQQQDNMKEDKSKLIERKAKALVKSETTVVRLGLGFQKPPIAPMTRVNFFGEIVRAQGFDVHSLSVGYELWMPGEWKWSTGDPSRRYRAVSHTSEVYLNPTADPFTADKNNLHANISFPYAFELTTKPAQSHHVGKYPTLFLYVYSTDYWGVVRPAGYGFIQLPQDAGCVTKTVRMWVPQGSIRDELQRFYVGGSGYLHDPKDSGVPAGHSISFLNKYGLRTKATGSVEVRVNTIITTPSSNREI